MKVFISWSGDRSKKTADLLKTWLSCVIQAVKPWVSTSDIDRGARWQSEIGDKLQECHIGIICLTLENRQKPWIHFEAGALTKGLEQNRVCTFLVDLNPEDIENPLAQFNHTTPNKEGLLSLVKTLNAALGETALAEDVLDRTFQTNWPSFENDFKIIIEQSELRQEVEQRSVDSMVKELLQMTRAIAKQVTRQVPKTTEYKRLKHPNFTLSPLALVSSTPTVESFLEATAEFDEEACISPIDLFENYCSWCETHYQIHIDLSTFFSVLKHLGYPILKVSGNYICMGISIPKNN